MVVRAVRLQPEQAEDLRDISREMGIDLSDAHRELLELAMLEKRRQLRRRKGGETAA